MADPSLMKQLVQTWTGFNRWLAIAVVLPYILVGLPSLSSWAEIIAIIPAYLGVLVLLDLIHFLVITPFIRWFKSPPTPEIW